MKLFSRCYKFLSARSPLFVALTVLVLFAVAAGVAAVIFASRGATDSNQIQYHVVTIYDEDVEKTVITTTGNVADALKSAEISIGQYDHIEPALDQELKEAILIVNIRRARPIVVVDGRREVRTITASRDREEIAAKAGIKLYPEDEAELSLPDDLLLTDGAGLLMKVERAKVVNLRLYGQDLVVRTQKSTVAELLEEKGIKLGFDDGMDLALDTPIKDGMSLRVWREGIQTVTATEVISFTTKIVTDPTRKVGYREIQTKGQDGQRTVIYEIEVRDGQEVGRRILSEVIDMPPVEQVELVGIKSSLEGVPPLSARRGAQTYWVGPILRKETYYDLPMGVVMRNCGQGGYYTVRADGVKVDRDGFVIVAANLNRYPRCSEVDTSVGRGKVYDTGGFAKNNPEQFDIATDWTNRDGR
ncbi:ubiquitin-like domain-containing protein [Candidatus Saccharibacteria bacterium]|nr:ubiquitin-like domain-containing protein [Candidatus Saccharibacteria bacterium]